MHRCSLNDPTGHGLILIRSRPGHQGRTTTDGRISAESYDVTRGSNRHVQQRAPPYIEHVSLQPLKHASIKIERRFSWLSRGSGKGGITKVPEALEGPRDDGALPQHPSLRLPNVLNHEPLLTNHPRRLGYPTCPLPVVDHPHPRPYLQTAPLMPQSHRTFSITHYKINPR